MNLRDPRLWLSAASVLVVLSFVLWDSERTSPGPLAAPHARIPVLAAADGCDACHGGRFGSMEASCGECHAPIAAQIDAGTGLHGALAEAGPTGCAGCHSEHHGAEFSLAGPVSYSRAGLPPAAAFDHSHVDFRLTGRHARLACAECHANAELPVLAEGEHRFIGLEQACQTCHDDPHQGRFARSCEACHGQELPFADVASFVHTAAFPLTGGHARESCSECHEPGSAHAIEALAGFAAPPPARDCSACHDSPHDERFLAEAADVRAVSAGASCALCHDALHGGFGAPPVATPAELHAATGFALTGPHADVACAGCHAEGGSFAERYPGRAYASCGACHADPHRGEFDSGVFAGEGCLACHAEEAFRPPAFGFETHARTGFPLVDSHRAVACSACHRSVHADGAASFAGTSPACAACHADVHAGTFGQRGCGACHTSSSFGRVAEGAFAHGRDARFALEGAHASLACQACHRREPSADAAGRSFGRAAGRDCASCHATVHDAFFAGVDCASCHGTESFSELAGPFEHAAWTGFELTGAHARGECAACHGFYPDAAAAGRRLGRVAQLIDGPPERCESCHADPHGAAFTAALPRAAVAEGCSGCHDTESFGAARAGFDHGSTGYELAGAHAELTCAACHAPLAGRDARGRHSARALGRDCSACHADPHAGQFAAEGRTDCARCHSTDGFIDRLTFDHGRDSRFALDASHRGLACAACHRTWPLPGGGEAVRYKPLGTRCVDCHDHGGGER
jgi:predicted CXXCH cytochrome family protein